MKKIPIGIDDFKELREKDAYFVDKSLLISELLESITKVTLITRPRRFGKSLNFSMLKYFLQNPKNSDYCQAEISKCFNGLRIMDNTEIRDEYFCKYPVIELSFKKVKASNWDFAAAAFKEEIASEYLRHSYLLQSDLLMDFQKEEFSKIMTKKADIFDFTSAIRNLSSYLKKYYQQKVIVLIDEYDTPLHYAKLNDYYTEMLDIMRAFMVDTMKDNPELEKALITGIMKISQESMFSGFNNAITADLSDSLAKDKFGFTETEVRELLNYYSLESQENTVREWYNGYLFGRDTIIYNPWSMLNFLADSNHQPQSYWINSGDNSLLRRCFKLDQLKSKSYLETLLKDDFLTEKLEKNIIYEDIFNNVDKALSFLLHSGYLKAELKDSKDNYYNFSIPNKEIKEIYKNILDNWFAQENKSAALIQNLIKSLLAEDFESFEVLLEDLLMANISYYDSSSVLKISSRGEEREKQENFFHGLMLGLMLYLDDNYYILSNQEFGQGRPDLVIMPEDKDSKAYVLEFKNEYSNSKVSVQKAAAEALKQIKEKEYPAGIKKTGVKRIVEIGLGFKGKKCSVRY
ncbi:AAA family ATPase [Halanaerobium sp.]|uniref:AAA family ATPase n=1 Tax=Halanaerobium sp. TaxID=1895664 RepID=UPI000DE79587|nr:AAA family ATPase [Halanaerobium sp.]PUU95480.1 MAG: Protein of unknown function (DUF1703)/Predicted AAA-ATPase [Halanaerobium sp.]